MGNIFADNINFRRGEMVVEEDGQVQEIIATSDTKQFFTTAVNEFFMQTDEAADTQWQSIFRVVPGRGHGELFPFRPPTAVTTVSAGSALAAEDEVSSGMHGIVFNEVGEGGEIKFSRVISAEKYVRHVKYATAIGYSNEWFSDGQMALVEMVTEDFREAANDKMAAIHYGAIVAAVNSGLSTTTDINGTGTSNVAKVINTLNDITTVMRRQKRRPGILLVPPECETVAALALKTQGETGAGDLTRNESVSRLQLVVTEYIATGTAYVIEPKRRLISTNRLPLSLGSFQDLLHDSEVLVGKFRRGVLVGEAAVIHGFTNFPTTVVSTQDF
tara:strand:+ start:6742 stop:7731 length:990 start_codon:yes stop_codon:yes gene_type:complete